MDTPVEQETGEEAEEGAQVAVLRWVPERLIFPDVVEPSVDTESKDILSVMQQHSKIVTTR